MNIEDYGKIPMSRLLERIRLIHGYDTYKQKSQSVARGIDFCERVEDFYNWCYINKIS